MYKRQAANIAKVLTEPGTVVYVKSGDEKYKAQIEKAFGDTVTIAVDDLSLIHISVRLRLP